MWWAFLLSQEEESNIGNNFPPTPFTLSAEIGATPRDNDVAFESLQPPPPEPIDLDAVPVKMEPEEVDDEDLIPLSVLGQQRQLMSILAAQTIHVPLRRVRKKTSPSKVKHWRLVYLAGAGPLAPKPKAIVRSYRCMIYRKTRPIVAIRQRSAPRSQVGQARIPEGMSECKARWVAGMVQKTFLQKDSSWEPYTSAILGQLLASAPADEQM